MTPCSQRTETAPDDGPTTFAQNIGHNPSTAFATQLATKERHNRLGGDTIADAILDRIVHNTIWIDTGEYNMRQHHGQTMPEP